MRFDSSSAGGRAPDDTVGGEHSASGRAVHELTHAYADDQNVWTMVRLRDADGA